MNEIDLERLSLYLDGQLAQSDERALETRLARDGSLRAALDSLRVADRWLRDPETWSAGSHDALSARLSLPPVGEENAELGALRAAVEAYEDGSIPAASESLLQRVKARGTPSRSRSGRRRKASVRLVRRSGRLRLGSGSGSNRLPLRRASARISARQSARRPSAAGRVSAAGRANPSAPWSAWAGLLAAACLAFVVGGLVFSQPPRSEQAAAVPAAPVSPPERTPEPRIAKPEAAEPEAAEPEAAEPEAAEPEAAEPKAAEPEAAGEGESTAPLETVAEREVLDDGGRLRIDPARLRGSLERFADGAWAPLSEVAELAPGQRLRATEPSFASLEHGAYELCLDAGSELLVLRAQDGPVLELERGRVLAEVVSLQQHERFEVRAGPSAFQVLGTVFEVAREGQAADLGVLEGAVRASRGAEALVASAGHGVRVADGVTPLDAPQAGAWAKRLRAERRTSWAVDFEGGAAGWSGEAVSTAGRGGQALALEASTERAWARSAAVEHTLTVSPDLYLQVSVFSEADASVMLRFTNASQDGRPFMATYALHAGQWRTLTVPFEALSTLYDPGLNPLRTGDRLSRLEVFAGKPGAPAAVLIDDLRVYRKHYR